MCGVLRSAVSDQSDALVVCHARLCAELHCSRCIAACLCCLHRLHVLPLLVLQATLLSQVGIPQRTERRHSGGDGTEQTHVEQGNTRATKGWKVTTSRRMRQKELCVQVSRQAGQRLRRRLCCVCVGRVNGSGRNGKRLRHVAAVWPPVHLLDRSTHTDSDARVIAVRTTQHRSASASHSTATHLPVASSSSAQCHK